MAGKNQNRGEAPREEETANTPKQLEKQFEGEMKAVHPDADKAGKNWWIGGAPSQAMEWAVKSVAKAGLYPSSECTRRN